MVSPVAETTAAIPAARPANTSLGDDWHATATAVRVPRRQFITGLGSTRFLPEEHLGLGAAQHRFAALAHQRPAVCPLDRLQVDDAPVKTGILKMEEPPVVVRRVHQAPLMRTVDIGAALGQHDLVLVGP